MGWIGSEEETPFQSSDQHGVVGKAKGLHSERVGLKHGSYTFKLRGPAQETTPFFTSVFSSGKWDKTLDLKELLRFRKFL